MTLSQIFLVVWKHESRSVQRQFHPLLLYSMIVVLNDHWLLSKSIYFFFLRKNFRSGSSKKMKIMYPMKTAITGTIPIPHAGRYFLSSCLSSYSCQATSHASRSAVIPPDVGLTVNWISIQVTMFSKIIFKKLQISALFKLEFSTSRTLAIAMRDQRVWRKIERSTM